MAINDRNIIQIRKALGQVLQNSATATDATNGVLDLLELAERATAEDTSKMSPPPEIVRVMRIYVFEGERKTVEEQLARPIAPSLVIDHLCGNRRCINPLHLEMVTSTENLLRSSHYHRTRTVCLRGGHPLEGRSIGRGRIRRFCRICKNIAARRDRKQKKEQAS